MAEGKSYLWVWILVVVIVIGLGIGSYFWMRQEQPQKYTGPVEKITLAAYAGDTVALVYVTEDQGFLKKWFRY